MCRRNCRVFFSFLFMRCLHCLQWEILNFVNTGSVRGELVTGLDHYWSSSISMLGNQFAIDNLIDLEWRIIWRLRSWSNGFGAEEIAVMMGDCGVSVNEASLIGLGHEDKRVMRGLGDVWCWNVKCMNYIE